MERCNFARNKGTNAYTCASTFYGLEALKTAVQFGQHRKYDVFLKSNKRLLEDIQEYQEVLIEKLSHMLYDYSVIACYGELRHCASTSHARYRGAGFPKRTKGGRNEAYVKALDYSPQAILSLCEEAFDPSNHWDDVYGGAKWQAIAKHGLRYQKVNNLIFCDTAFSLSHNCSPFLNKSESRIFFINSSSQYKDLLDIKFERALDDVIWFIVNNGKEYDRKFVQLIDRCKNLGFIKLHDHWMGHIRQTNVEKIDLLTAINNNYEPLIYQQKRLTPKKMNKWCNTIKEQKFYEQLKVGMNVMLDEKEHFTYRISQEKLRNDERYAPLFTIWNHKVTNVTELTEKIGFVNSYQNLVIEEIKDGYLTVKVGNGDVINIEFRKVVGIDERFKPIKLK